VECRAWAKDFIFKASATFNSCSTNLPTSQKRIDGFGGLVWRRELAGRVCGAIISSIVVLGGSADPSPARERNSVARPCERQSRAFAGGHGIAQHERSLKINLPRNACHLQSGRVVIIIIIIIIIIMNSNNLSVVCLYKTVCSRNGVRSVRLFDHAISICPLSASAKNAPKLSYLDFEQQIKPRPASLWVVEGAPLGGGKRLV